MPDRVKVSCQIKDSSPLLYSVITILFLSNEDNKFDKSKSMYVKVHNDFRINFDKFSK